MAPSVAATQPRSPTLALFLHSLLLLHLLTLSFLPLANAQGTLCPATCGDSPSSATSWGDTAVISTAGLGSPTQCAQFCSFYLFYEFLPIGNANNPSTIDTLCNCFAQCTATSITASAATEYTGLTVACNRNFQPLSPPNILYSGNGNYGWSATDPAIVSRTSGITSASGCETFCLGTASSLVYQFAASANAGSSGFAAGDCICLSSIPTSRLLNLAPQAFTQGNLCLGEAPPALCSTPVNYLPPAACRVTGPCIVAKMPTVEYKCYLCNTDPVQTLVDVQLSATNFQPLSVNDITTGGVVQTTVKPLSCTTFSFKNLASAGVPSLGVHSDPFRKSRVVIGTNVAGSPMVITGCTQTGYCDSSAGTLYNYQCTILNASPRPVADVQLSCTNFEPVSIYNMDQDCSFSKVFSPGDTRTFSFKTLPGFITFAVAEWTLL